LQQQQRALTKKPRSNRQPRRTIPRTIVEQQQVGERSAVAPPHGKAWDCLPQRPRPVLHAYGADGTAMVSSAHSVASGKSSQRRGSVPRGPARWRVAALLQHPKSPYPHHHSSACGVCRDMLARREHRTRTNIEDQEAKWWDAASGKWLTQFMALLIGAGSQRHLPGVPLPSARDLEWAEEVRRRHVVQLCEESLRFIDSLLCDAIANGTGDWGLCPQPPAGSPYSRTRPITSPYKRSQRGSPYAPGRSSPLASS